ncbi:Zinc/iron permease [Scenedesmus sp. NREL 46B-D3]|nr:Zinc/iron permease [Scenedesmus sp. NREL 46B-D3]
MACQLDESCSLSDGPSAAGGLHETVNTPVTSMLRLGAALALFLEGLAGVYIPVLLKSFQGYEWWLSLLNCFSGGVFLAAGLVHLLPHCAEAQQRLGPLVGDYPLYLVLITLGYMLVLFVERVLFDVHGSAHGHGPHTGIAPPCVDCRTAEGMLLSSSGDPAGISNHSMHSADDADRQQQQQQQAASAAGGVDGANGQLTPGQGRYNLRSRTHGTPQQGNSANGAAEDLVKPLLTDAAGAAREQHVDEHGGHMHAADHSHAHADGCSAGHSVSLQQQHAHAHLAHTHHHAVVVAGDLRQGMVLLVAMAVHTFLECMALGLMDQRKEFLMLFMAIASHKLISGLALSSRFLKDGATTRQITLYVGPFVIVAPTAILAGMYVSNVHPLVHLALSCFATGTFLYVGASEIVEEEFEGDMRSGRTDITQVFARWVKFLMLLLGVAAIALLSMIPDAHDHGSGGLGHGSHTHGLGAGGTTTTSIISAAGRTIVV